MHGRSNAECCGFTLWNLLRDLLAFGYTTDVLNQFSMHFSKRIAAEFPGQIRKGAGQKVSSENLGGEMCRNQQWEKIYRRLVRQRDDAYTQAGVGRRILDGKAVGDGLHLGRSLPDRDSTSWGCKPQAAHRGWTGAVHPHRGGGERSIPGSGRQLSNGSADGRCRADVGERTDSPPAAAAAWPSRQH